MILKDKRGLLQQKVKWFYRGLQKEVAELNKKAIVFKIKIDWCSMSLIYEKVDVMDWNIPGWRNILNEN